MRKRKCQRVLSVALVGTIGATSFSQVALAATPTVHTVADAIALSENVSDAARLNEIMETVLRLYGGKDNFLNMVTNVLDQGGHAEPQIDLLQGAKAVAKVLKTFGDDIIKAIRKIPGVGNAIGDFLSSKIGPLANFLEKFSGGAEAGISAFLQSCGLSKEVADTIAAVIMFIVGFFL